MFKLLKIIKDVGRVTTEYPFSPAVLQPAFRGKPEYTPQQCIACGACANVCPANALTMETKVEENIRIWEFFVGRCIYCARCEEVCPTRALKLGQQFELAVFKKEDLYERASFRLCHCKKCGEAFAPQREVDFALALILQHIGKEEDERLKEQFETCSHCKRKECLQDPR